MSFQFEISYSTTFFDFNDLPSYERRIVEWDFTENLTRFLSENHLAPAHPARAIANCLFQRMSDRSLHYHTPVHVLALLDFSQKHNIHLDISEQLAIWFHDAIYVVTSDPGDNEADSADFMMAMLNTFKEGRSKVSEANRIIRDTSKHLHPNPLSSISRLVMDLDLSSFAGEYDLFKLAGDLVRKEYPDISDQQFMEGRKKFLVKLRDKGFIFRTERFKEDFETRAFENIEKFLTEKPCEK